MNERDEQLRFKEINRTMEIARNILAQLGGHKFVTMTGAKEIFALDSGLRFKLPGTMTKRHINMVSIVLTPMDTYSMKFEKIRLNHKTWECTRRTIAEHDMVYDDHLQEIFTQETGLDTHL